MSVKNPDIGEVCIGKYVNLSELFFEGIVIIADENFPKYDIH